MRNKRILVRTLTRVFYVGAVLFLLSGIMLSTFSAPVIAAASSSHPAGQSSSFLQRFSLQDSYPPAQNPQPIAQVTFTPIGSGPSSLIFSSGCDCSCTEVVADVCNVGGPMQGPVEWNLYYSRDGNPALGQVVRSGQISPLAYGECVNLNYSVDQPGNYSYRMVQEEVHVGPDVVWSNSCMVSGTCFPTATPGVTDTPEITPTFTLEPTVTNTRVPLEYNLSAVCDYAGRDYLLWKVANTTGVAVDYTWRVVDSNESGSGRVDANSDDYFTTSAGAKTVRLYVNDQLVDTQGSVGPCKEDLILSYACTPDGLDWFVRNPNNFAVDIRWFVNGAEAGRGVLAANESRLIAQTPVGDNDVEVRWTDTRPLVHSVRLVSDAASCAPGLTITPPTFTPTVTETLPVPTLTFTPTITETQPGPTLTFTPTVTQPVITSTFTPTVTLTQPGPTLTFTPTFTQPAPTLTFTPTLTQPVPTLTFTPTITLTQPGPTLTFTPTFTQPAPTLTFTPTFTQPAPTLTFTPTFTQPAPSVTPQTAPTFPIPTFTNTVPAQPAPTSTLTLAPTVTQTPTITQIVTLAPPAQVSTPAIIPVTGFDRVAATQATNLLGKLFMNIGMVLFGLALAFTAAGRQMKD